MDKTPKIFISYSWKDKKVVDKIDDDFRKIGITFTRDIRDAGGYKKSLKEFMQQIRDNDYVLMVISDSFLKSMNCMYEVLEVVKEKKFKKRILQIVLDGATIYTPKDRLGYLTYWEEELSELEKQAEERRQKNLGTTSEDLKQIDLICSTIGEFLDFLSDEYHPSYEELIKTGYKPILDYIGFDDSGLIEQLMKITNIENAEQQNIEIEKFFIENPNNYFGHLFQAIIESNRKEYSKSAFHFDELVKNFPDNKMTYFFRGNNDFARKNYDEAINNYNYALKLEADDFETYNNRGNTFAEIGENQKAIQDYSKAIELNPDDPEVYYNRGNTFLRTGEYQKTIQDCNKIIELRPDNPATYLLRGSVYMNIKKMDEASRDFNKAIEINPNSSIIYLSIGIILFEHDNYKKALSHINRAIELTPDEADFYETRAEVYKAMDEIEKAEQDLEMYRKLKEKEDKN